MIKRTLFASTLGLTLLWTNLYAQKNSPLVDSNEAKMLDYNHTQTYEIGGINVKGAIYTMQMEL